LIIDCSDSINYESKAQQDNKIITVPNFARIFAFFVVPDLLDYSIFSASKESI
jgi:hypothetical protein